MLSRRMGHSGRGEAVKRRIRGWGVVRWREGGHQVAHSAPWCSNCKIHWRVCVLSRGMEHHGSGGIWGAGLEDVGAVLSGRGGTSLHSVTFVLGAMPARKT